MRHTRRAVEIDPYNAYAHHALFETSYFDQDLDAAKIAGRHSLELNPRDSNAMAIIGMFLAFSGDWEYGLSLADRATELNHNAPGWFWFARAFNHFRLGEYEQALTYVQRVNMPQYHVYNANMSMTLGHLDRKQDARKYVDDFLSVWGGDLEGYRISLDRWFFGSPDLVQRICEGWKKAGLDLPEAKPN